MEIKTLNKYNRSRLNGSLIKHLSVDEESGLVVVESEDGNNKEFYVDSEMTAPCGADYILCDLQHNPEISVSKY
jgi:hypothetical protein